jgi:hypothetical protein
MLRYALASALLVYLPLVAQDKLFSGPQPGEPISPFHVLAVNGPNAGREVDIVSEFGDSPMLLIFIGHLDRNLAGMLTPCEQFAIDRAPAGLKALYVFLAPDKIEGERRMQAVIGSLKLKSFVGVSVDGVEGPGAYGLNKEVAATVLVADHRKVTANFAIVQPRMVDAPKIQAELAKLVGGHVTTMAELGAQRAAQGKGMMPMNQDSSPAGPPELATMLRSLIQRSNSNGQVDLAVEDLRKWANSDPEHRALLVKKLAIIIPLKYGTSYAQLQMQTLKDALDK